MQLLKNLREQRLAVRLSPRVRTVCRYIRQAVAQPNRQQDPWGGSPWAVVADGARNLGCHSGIHAYFLPAVKNVNSDVAYTYIRKRILNGEFRPGQPLMTKELALEIGVSRTPVRDALRQLEADGLVIIRAHMGASVKAMTLKEYREMCGLRLALESYAAGLAAENRTAEELQEMKQALEPMRELTGRLVAGSKRDQALIDEMRRHDVRFHIAVITAAKSELLKKEVLRLHIVSRVVAGPSPNTGKPDPDKAADNAHRLEVQEYHDQIYHAIERGDAAAAKAVMERHIQDIVDTNVRLLARREQSYASRELTEEELSYTT
jgi:DNA-binding GntR family transcriptional regulator